MGYHAKVLADSVSSHGYRLTTMEVRYPRLIHAEFMTHRVFSRNTASSRAIPIKKQIEIIETDPFVPTYWGANQSGMQAEQELSPADADKARAIWLAARDDAVKHARELQEIGESGVHKQLTNRILEPFMWHVVIVTATEWDNFFALRANASAQPEIRKAAELMRQALADSTPQTLGDGEWHLPLIQPDERDGDFEKTAEARAISAARCARVSYLTHDGRRDKEADLTLYHRLISEGHMSPLEHVARPLTNEELKQGEWRGNFRGWLQLRKTMPHEDNFGSMQK